MRAIGIVAVGAILVGCTSIVVPPGADLVPQLYPGLTRSILVFAPAPEYPAEARQRDAHGDGYFVLHVDRFSGIVNSVEVLRSTGDRTLDAAALKALRQWRFKGGGVVPTGSD